MKTFRRLGGFSGTGFIEDKLGSEEVKLLLLTIPPLAGEFLSRVLQEIAGWS